MQQQLVKNAVVLGAGVTGLTTALKLQARGGYKVSIIASDLPTDYPRKAEYASPWAGAHHMLYTGRDARDKKIEAETFKAMWELSAPGGAAEHCFRRMRETEYYRNKVDLEVEWMPDLRPVAENALIPEAKSGYSYTTYSVDPALYINYLLSRFLSGGGIVVRGDVKHVSQVVEGGVDLFTRGTAAATRIDALVVCAGVGARSLGGVEDEAVYPSRGQVIILNTPWITEAVRLSDSTGAGAQTYVVPRRDGTVAIGSTKEANDWYPVARPGTTEDILRRCLVLCPELAPPDIRAKRAGTIEDLRPLIVEVGCGLRPGRKGGVRLEYEWIDADKSGRKIPLVYNYGHAGVGFEMSWGSASAVLDMLENAKA
ncbi:D-aspartate oxidase [Daedalea quercina L-15889]|uniref:D-aspartate oxidase n=1 Tax=Daedalea quercina L-15889 TaxID=1314783 RepID=A0A165PMG5_9APHY|nr:D-aspartate oxidase [Daedalea quercina L-15889]